MSATQKVKRGKGVVVGGHQNKLGRTMKWILREQSCLPSNKEKAMKVVIYLFVETECHCAAQAYLQFPLLPQPPQRQDSRCEPTQPIWVKKAFAQVRKFTQQLRKLSLLAAVVQTQSFQIRDSPVRNLMRAYAFTCCCLSASYLRGVDHSACPPWGM